MRLLVDISGIAYASGYKLNLSNSKGRATGAIYGSLKTLRKLITDIHPNEVVICYDGGGNPQRISLLQTYKATRKSDPKQTLVREEVKRQLPILRGLLSHLPVIQIYQPGLEADDVIEVIATFCKHEDVGIVTRDHDLYQLITDKHVIINPNVTYSEVELTESARFYLWQKIICGDSSDNIPGVPGIGPVRSEQLLRKHGTLKNIIRHVRSEGFISSISYTEFLRLVKRNLKLIKLGELTSDSQRSEILSYYKRARLNVQINKELFFRGAKDLDFESIYSRVKAYLHPFKCLERKPSRHEQRQTSEKHFVRKEDTECSYARKIRNPTPARAKRVRRPRDKEVTTYFKRVRKVKIDGLDSASRRPDANRAVQSNNGKARLVRVGLRNSGVPKNTEFRKRASMRRNNAMSILQDLQTGSGLVWLQLQEDDVIQFVNDLVEAMKVEEFTMPRRYLEKLEAIYQDYANEAPEWM